MRTRILSILFSCAMLAVAQTTPKINTSDVEIKEIPAGSLVALRAAEANIETAVEALAKAKAAVEDAQRVKDRLVSEITGEWRLFEGGCTTPENKCVNNNCPAVYYMPMRSYRRAEIRGKYGLVTSGKEACPYGTAP